MSNRKKLKSALGESLTLSSFKKYNKYVGRKFNKYSSGILWEALIFPTSVANLL